MSRRRRLEQQRAQAPKLEEIIRSMEHGQFLPAIVDPEEDDEDDEEGGEADWIEVYRQAQELLKVKR